MDTCEHNLIHNLKNVLSQIEREIIDNKSKNIKLKCFHCQDTSNLYISITNGLIICEKHKFQEKNSLLYFLKDKSVFCSICNKSIVISTDFIKKIEENFTKNIKVYDYYVIKNMTDLGKTTAMSSILQVLLNTPQIRDYYLGFIHDMHNCNIQNCFDCISKKMINQIYSEKTIILNEVVYYIMKKTKLYENMRIDDLKTNFVLFSNAYHTNLQKKIKCKCIMHKNIFWFIEQRYSCSYCKNKVKNIEEFTMINMTLSKDLQIALQKLLNVQLLNDNYVFCNNCNKKTKIYIERKFCTFPKLLCIYFDRFSEVKQNKNSSIKLKINQTLCIDEYKYDLYAFIVEKNIKPSYFVTYILLNKIWYKITSEKIVKNVNISNSIKNSSMIFFSLQDSETFE